MAKIERDGAAHEKKTKAIQQQFELVKLQTEQAKNAREQQSRLLNAEKVGFSIYPSESRLSVLQMAHCVYNPPL